MFFLQQIPVFAILIYEKAKNSTDKSQGGVSMTVISAISLIVLTFGAGWFAIRKTESIIP